MEDLYRNIRERRIELGLTQEELAKKLGYADKSMIAKIEAGKIDLAQSKILAFADALFTTPSALMGWVDEQDRADTKQQLLERAFSDRPEMHMLFSVAEKATKEDIEKTIRILEALKSE